jgi:hypothetical protein
MLKLNRTAFLLLLVGFLANTSLAFAATAAASAGVTSESQITVTGAGIPGETYSLTKAYGDWFSTATDAHASLTLLTAPGPHRAQLGIQWDGKALTQTITEANNSDVGGSDRFTFFLHLIGSGAYNQDAQPRGSDAITITVTRMDDLVLEANIAGTITGNGPLTISGSIKLHRDVAPSMVSGSFRDCDPHIYDKMAGAEARSPSECEVKFDTFVRQALLHAVQPVLDNLTQNGWVTDKMPEMGPITSIARHSEKAPFQLAIAVSLMMRKDTDTYAHYNQALTDAMQKMADEMKTGGPAAAQGSVDALQDATRAMQEHTTIVISLAINEPSVGIENFKGGHTVTPLAGGYSISVPYAQAATGGDISASQRATYVLLGPFSPVASTPQGGGAEHIDARGNLNAGRLMTVQSIRIRIQTGTELAQQVIKLLDWSALQQLMAGK